MQEMMATVTRSSIIKVVGEAPIVIEAIVRVLGGRQGSGGQGEKQNRLKKDYTVSKTASGTPDFRIEC